MSDIAQKLISRFNGHSSDVNVKPKSCELTQHFHLNVYVVDVNVYCAG